MIISRQAVGLPGFFLTVCEESPKKSFCVIIFCMARCVIISAAKIADYDRIHSFLFDDDFFIFCDGGLGHARSLGVKPDLITGDFDSFDKNKLNQFGDVETLALPCEKDDTDTFFAVKEGLKRGFTEFLLLGAAGGRFDHSLCNVSALIYLFNHGAEALLVDDYSVMRITGSRPDGSYEETVTGDCSYFSLMNVAGNVSGVTIRDAKYSLEDAEIKAEYAFGVSNENLPGKNARITVKKGILLLVEVK